jgi:hypothetical protein
MKQSKLSKLENKYYYGISRYFWHTIIAFSLLLIIGGITVYLWSMVPPSKKTVVKGPKPIKQAYPEMKKVNLQDILNQLNIKNEKIKNTNYKQTIEDPEEYLDTQIYDEVNSVALERFNKQIEETKKLIPDSIFPFFWKDQYEYYFESKRNEKMYKKTHNPLLRKRKITKKGFRLHFIDKTNKLKITDYNDKADILESANLLMKFLDVSNRVSFMNNVSFYIPVKQMGTQAIQRKFSAMGKVINKIDPDSQLKTYNILWNFITKNPNDGTKLVNYEGDIISKFQPINRLNIIKKIQHQYRKRYNNKLETLIEATNQFLPYLNEIEADKQIEALTIYYDLYYKNNKERSKQIQLINEQYNKALANLENQYQIELNKSEMEYQLKKSTKNKFRSYSYEGIAAGFASILIITLILLILSMIRNVNQLSEAIYENTKLFQEQILKTINNKEQIKKE